MRKRMKRKDMEFAIWYLLMQTEELCVLLARDMKNSPFYNLAQQAQGKALAIHLKTTDLLTGKS